MNLNSYFSILLPCLSEIIQQSWCALGVTRDRPSLQHVRCARCTPWLSIKGQWHTCVLTAIFTPSVYTAIRLPWRCLMMTAVIESVYVTYLSALNMRYDWFFQVLRAYHFLTDNSLQSAVKKPCCGRETARCGQKFDTFEIYSGIARSTLR